MRSRSHPQRKWAGRVPRVHRIGIAYDGELTEDAYFRGWKQVLSQASVSIFPTYVKSGGNPLEAVKAAAKLKRSQRDLAELWCVTDVDGCPPSVVTQAQTTATSAGIRLCLSNRCFEVWLAAHFGRSTKPINCEADAIELVANHETSYCSQNKTLSFSILFPRTDIAIANSEWMAAQGQVNPLTNVQDLVKKLKSNL